MKKFQDKIFTGEKDKVELACFVRGRPSPRVTWKKNNEPIHFMNHVNEINGTHRHVIIIRSVKQQDIGIYTCTANNSQGFAQANITITSEF